MKHADKKTYDNRAVQRQTKKEPSLNEMLTRQLFSGVYSSTPNWKWRSTGVFAYTHDADAARYVAQCRQREMDKMRAKLAIVAKRETRIEVAA